MVNIIGCKTPIKPMFFELDINDPPPILILAINPSDFSKSFTKKVVNVRTRPRSRNQAAYLNNFVFDELDTMQCSGRTALFYGTNGLTTENRINSLAYRNFRSLVEVYRNNGRNYNSTRYRDPLITGGSGLIKSVGRVIIAYDDIIYKGSFDSFSVSEEEILPFNFQFNFQFTVSKTLDVRNP